MRYKAEGVPLVVFAGKEYGTGSSRDWAAKGTRLLGIRAVIAQSFERIHRSNLVGMGVLPLVFEAGHVLAEPRHQGQRDGQHPRPHRAQAAAEAGCRPSSSADGKSRDIEVLCRIDTEEELSYYRQRRHPAVRAAQPGERRLSEGKG